MLRVQNQVRKFFPHPHLTAQPHHARSVSTHSLRAPYFTSFRGITSLHKQLKVQHALFTRRTPTLPAPPPTQMPQFTPQTPTMSRGFITSRSKAISLIYTSLGVMNQMSSLATFEPQRKFQQGQFFSTCATPSSNTCPDGGAPAAYPAQNMYEVPMDYDDATKAVVDQIKEVIELKISEAIRNDGGDIHYICYHPDTQVVDLALTGACESCDKSAVTLQILVTNALRFYFPDHVKKVKRIRLPGQEERNIKDLVYWGKIPATSYAYNIPMSSVLVVILNETINWAIQHSRRHFWMSQNFCTHHNSHQPHSPLTLNTF